MGIFQKLGKFSVLGLAPTLDVPVLFSSEFSMNCDQFFIINKSPKHYIF